MVYYFYGTDWMRGKLYLDELKKEHLGSRLASFNLEEEWEGFCEAIQTETRSDSLFGGKVLIVGKTDKLSKEQLKFLQTLKVEAGGAVLIIWELSSRPSWKPKSKGVMIKEFNELSLAGARNWVGDYIKSKQLSIPEEVVGMLLEIFGSRLDFIVQELEKYSLLHASPVPIGSDQAIAVWENSEKDFFEWVRSVLEYDAAGIEKYMPPEDQLMRYLTGLINAVRGVILARGKLKDVGTNPYWLKRLIGWSSGQTNESLQELFTYLLELDLDIRAGKVDMSQVILALKTRLIAGVYPVGNI